MLKLYADILQTNKQKLTKTHTHTHTHTYIYIYIYTYIYLFIYNRWRVINMWGWGNFRFTLYFTYKFQERKPYANRTLSVAASGKDFEFEVIFVTLVLFVTLRRCNPNTIIL